MRRSPLLLTGLLMSQTLMADNDPFLWLENVDGERALDWVARQNTRSLERLEAHSLFAPIHARNREILTSDERIAMPSLMGGRVYNFWRDSRQVRGIWRVTSVASYRQSTPEWDLLLDIDALALKEQENWVWAGANCRHPDYDRCVISLSRGGADAAVHREFDLGRREFVADGFMLPESKSRIAWRDRDSVFFGPAFSDQEMTDSGYPRTVRIWRRGTPYASAQLIFEGDRRDVSVVGRRYWDGEDHHDLIVRVPDFFTRHFHLYRDGVLERLHVPDDADVADVFHGQLLIELKSDWTVGQSRFRQGSLVSAPIADLLAGPRRTPRVELLFEPDARAAIADISTTEKTVIVNVLDNVTSRLLRFTRGTAGWQRLDLDVPPLGSISMVAADDSSDRFYYSYAGFLTPSTLVESDAGLDSHRYLRSEPVWFDAEGMVVAQHEATSADGERIPYFVVTPRDLDPDAAAPTVLAGYGGFEVARTPFYSGLIGSAWLERGGVYVLANIRGGGEFGPRWHQAALLENRQRAFDDFIAVAEDLIARGITSPERLGIQGGSNGGLLVGAALVQRPELFNAVVCQVPLLDMKRYHRLLAGASWMAEFGDPDDSRQWEFIGRYSPYQNVSAGVRYPVILFTTSTRDDRVHPGHARKMVAKMLDQEHDVLYYENTEGGHGGAANLEQTAYLNALIYAYLHDRLGSGERTEPRASASR